MPDETGKIIRVSEKTGYEFKNTDLLITALTHSSYSNENRLKNTCVMKDLSFRRCRVGIDIK